MGGGLVVLLLVLLFAPMLSILVLTVIYRYVYISGGRVRAANDSFSLVTLHGSRSVTFNEVVDVRQRRSVAVVAAELVARCRL